MDNYCCSCCLFVYNENMKEILERYIIIKKSKLTDFNDDMCELADFYLIAGKILEDNKFPIKLYQRYKKFIKNSRS